MEFNMITFVFASIIAITLAAPTPQPKAKPGVLALPYAAAPFAAAPVAVAPVAPAFVPAPYVTATSSQVVARNHNALAYTAPIVAAPAVAAPAYAATGPVTFPYVAPVARYAAPFGSPAYYF